MKGVYQHCGEKHLHRYLAEFDFRYSNRVRLGIDDEARTARASGDRRQAPDLPKNWSARVKNASLQSNFGRL